MRNVMKKLAGNRNGATAIEYGLIAGLIAVAPLRLPASFFITLRSICSFKLSLKLTFHPR